MTSCLRKYLASLALALLVARRHSYCNAFVQPTTTTRVLHTTHHGTLEKTTTKAPSVAALHLFGRQEQVASSDGASAHGKSSVVDGKPSFLNGVTVNGLNRKIPFVIERLGVRPSDEVFKNIAEMCIR